RDIKPSNIFLTQKGQNFDVAKLLDFGLVQTAMSGSLGLRQKNTKLFGSPAFMCPEQAVGMSPDGRGDIYSLGAVAYFMLTGRPPYTDENPIMLIVAHATSSAPTFEEIGADVPKDLGTVVMRCLHRDPSGRYNSARELLEALEACQDDACWTWRHAETWWHEHHPECLYRSSSDSSQQATIRLNRPERTAKESSVPSFDMPTDIHEIPRELQAV
ncbi:MAG: serine/threonine protein kinase, partial [Planctomycetaceae bacterium]|nr:serine/threonine protein kinase [Planctomycetaceae bacterium]